jgi:ankyrin repeat protein
VNQCDSQGRTPLYWAAIKGHTAMVQLLLKHRANANVEFFREGTMLHGAVVNGDETTVQLLLEHGADVNTKDLSNHIVVQIDQKNRSPYEPQLVIFMSDRIVKGERHCTLRLNLGKRRLRNYY